MRTLYSSALALLVALTMVPAGSGAESVSDEYTGAAGVRVLGVGPAVMCPNSCLNPDFAGEQPNIGGAHLVASQTYNNVVVSVDDQGLWGSSGAISTCFWNPDGDNICDDDDFGSETGCGSAALTGSPFAGDFVTVWVRTAAVTAELDVCGGTFGVVSGTFF